MFTLDWLRRWKADRQEFPTRWLSYKSRLTEDLKAAYATEGGKEFFDEKYISKLADAIRALDGWLVKLLIAQIAIGIFLVDWVVSSKPHGSIFGVSLQAKEIVLATSTIFAMASYFISGSRDLRVWTIETIVRLKSSKELVDFSLLAEPSGFHLRVYVTKMYSQWMFSRPLAKASFCLLLIIGVLLFGVAIFASYGLFIYVLWDVFHNPGLPVFWSDAVLAFVILGHLFGILWLLRLFVPLPYKDMSKLKLRPRFSLNSKR